jgi:hypothetical protein
MSQISSFESLTIESAQTLRVILQTGAIGQCFRGTLRRALPRRALHCKFGTHQPCAPGFSLRSLTLKTLTLEQRTDNYGES